ncbi:MAG: NlpC/P60 family protein [Gaiellaceae bacterium]|jgi:cell wall-associated NlpC family hydrolase
MIALAGAAPAAAAPRLQAQRQRAKVVYAQVSAINARLDGVVQAWDGARVQLTSVETALRANEARLRVARSNLGATQTRIEQRLVQLYVSPNPDSVAVLAGATSISDLIDRLEAVHVLTAQDSAIGQQAQRFQLQVSRRETLLRRERRQRAQTLARLGAHRRTIARDLANEQRLLATIHQSIQTLEAQQAARARRLAALAQARVARRVALARQEAAAAALTPAPSPFQADPPTQPATPPAAPASGGAPAPAAPPLVPAPAPATHAEAASIAARYLGVPYVWGGESPAGFDCSGLVSFVYAQLGVSLPHYTVSQWNATIPIATTDLQPGDLVFFDGLGHVGIYIGGGQFIHAPYTGTVVQIASLSGHWAANLDGARRVP